MHTHGGNRYLGAHYQFYNVIEAVLECPLVKKCGFIEHPKPLDLDVAFCHIDSLFNILQCLN